MTTPVAPPVTPPDLSGAVARRSPVEDVAATAAASKPAPASNDAAVEPPADFDTRLVIEEDKATKTFIYKTLDRRTGEVIQQFPREQVLRLHQEPGYQPGSVLRART